MTKRRDSGLFAQPKMLAVLVFVLLAYGALKDNYQVLVGTTDVELAKLDRSTVGDWVRVICDGVTGKSPTFTCRRGDATILVESESAIGNVVVGQVQSSTNLDANGRTQAFVLAILGCLSGLVAIGLGAWFAHQQIKQVA
jgi:hypothetical protein